jgi:hypothetical protein
LLNVVSVVALAVMGDVPADAHQAARERQRAKAAMFASQRIAPVASPERVEVLPVEDLLDQLKPGESASQLGLAAHFGVIETPRAVDAPTQRALRRILMDPRSYSSGVSGCAFSPFLALRHWSGEVFVDVLIGDKCFQVAFAENGRELLGYLLLTDRAAGRLRRVVARWRPPSVTGPQNNEMQRTRPAQAMEPRR